MRPRTSYLLLFTLLPLSVMLFYFIHKRITFASMGVAVRMKLSPSN